MENRQPPPIYKLQNTVQHYDWGSNTAISDLLGQPPDGRPAAELWLGAHPSAPSLAIGTTGANSMPLDALIRAQPTEMLGKRVLDNFGPELPYLTKILSAENALSLQVHPKAHLARAGFNRENRLGIPKDAFERSFHDPRHKPEMIIALTEFEAMAGIRAPRAALKAISGFRSPLFTTLRAALEADRITGASRQAITCLLNLGTSPERSALITDALAEVTAKVATHPTKPHLADLADLANLANHASLGDLGDLADRTVLLLASQYGDDIGIFAPYLLNIVTLQPGESLFLPSGEIHAYIRGLGIEIMANSDNVLRAGLTHKHVATDALLECMSFDAAHVTRPARAKIGAISNGEVYRAPVGEFGLTLYDLVPTEPLPLADNGPRIVLNLAGEIALMHSGGSTVLTKGESAFVPHAVGAVELGGAGKAFAAWVP